MPVNVAVAGQDWYRGLAKVDNGDGTFSTGTNITRNCLSQTLTIAISTTASTRVDGWRFAIFGLVMPAAFTGTAITFQVSADDAIYQDLYDATGTIKISQAVVASRSYDLPSELASWPFWKVVSGTTEVAARSLVVVCKG